MNSAPQSFPMSFAASMLDRNVEFSDRKTMLKMGIGYSEYNRIKSSAYQKFIRAFGTDEQNEKLGERERYSNH